MATTAMDYENANGDRFEDDGPRYDRDRSASPRRDEGHEGSRRRSASPAGNGTDRAMKDDSGAKDDDSINPGSNLFVTGIHPKLTEEEISRLFEKYGEVEKCQIMRDPHTKESRGFGFVKMVTSDQADAAKDGLQGEEIEGRTLSIEKARRSRPRTPTPGKYFGPPKREDPRPGGRFNDRFDDRRRGGGFGGGGGYGRDDPYRYRGYREDRGYDRNYDRGGYRDDRGGGGYYDRSYDRGAGGAGREERSGGYDRNYREERGGPERRDRDEGYGGSRPDRYGGGREDRDRYAQRGGGGGGSGGGGGGAGGGGEERRGPGYERDRYDRPSERDGAARPREGASGAGGYGDSVPRGDGREPYGA